MKGGKYTKTLVKIQARGIFRIRDIRRNVLPKRFVWRRHAGAHLDGHQHAADRNQRKHLLSSFGTKALIYSSRN